MWLLARCGFWEHRRGPWPRDLYLPGEKAGSKYLCTDTTQRPQQYSNDGAHGVNDLGEGVLLHSRSYLSRKRTPNQRPKYFVNSRNLLPPISTLGSINMTHEWLNDWMAKIPLCVVHTNNRKNYLSELKRTCHSTLETQLHRVEWNCNCRLLITHA